jgi:alpha-tubulin suppressor-like RCC1 family protein
MFKKPSKLLAALSLGTAMLFGARTANAQCGYFTGDGCPMTNYSNYGVTSTGAATLEYDNLVSSFHTSISRDYLGVYRIWGERAAADGVTNLLVPTEINSVNFPGLTGRVLKASTGSNQGLYIQTIVLTTDGLFAWGTPGGVVNDAVAPNTTLQKLQATGGDPATGLPVGVAPGQVKMMFTAYQTLAITTCDGNVYMLSNLANGVPRGDGSTGQTSWALVQDAANNTPLTGIVAVRGYSNRLVALRNDNTLYTWGFNVWLGNGTAIIFSAPRAVQMTLPAGEAGNAIKMIGMTGNSGAATYFVLYENGHLYGLGNNAQRQVGDWTVTNRNTWVQPRYPNAAGTAAGAVMNDILWVSPQEHNSGIGSTNVVNSAYQVYNWGSNSGYMLGRPLDDNVTYYNPGIPASFAPKVLAAETGGHTTMLAQACTQNYGYVGHRVNGSMGNGDAIEVWETALTFATAGVQICGATTVPQILTGGSGTTSTTGSYCNGSSLTLSGIPTGGTWAVVSGSATIAGNRLTFTGTGAGTVEISYTASTADCPNAVATKTFTVGDCKMNSVAGTIWNDANGNASLDGAEAGIDNDLWVNLVAPDGTVAGSAKVAADGTYSIAIVQENTAAGNYSVIVTNGERPVGAPLASATAPNGDYGYTGTSVDGVANTGNRSGVIEIGALSGAITAVDFGISNDPAVLPVKFGFVAAEIFNNQLKVKWNTTSELNNSYFEVEASVDGTNFISIGKVDSKATNGISAEALEYEFTKDASAGVVAAGIALLVAGAGLFKARRARYAMLAMALGMVVFAAGCNKNRRDALPEGKVYVRIAQVDRDGTKSYSKVVTVVRR